MSDNGRLVTIQDPEELDAVLNAPLPSDPVKRSGSCITLVEGETLEQFLYKTWPVDAPNIIWRAFCKWQVKALLARFDIFEKQP